MAIVLRLSQSQRVLKSLLGTGPVFFQKISLSQTVKQIAVFREELGVKLKERHGPVELGLICQVQANTVEDPAIIQRPACGVFQQGEERGDLIGRVSLGEIAYQHVDEG